MRNRRSLFSAATGLLLALAGVALAASGDPFAAEIARLRAASGGKPSPALVQAEQDLGAGRRLLALYRFADARAELGTQSYLRQRQPAQRQPAGFEAEWARMGTALRADLAKPSPGALDGVRPAAVRAVAEVALPKVRGFYDASLQQGRNTTAGEGLYYLASAQGQKEVVELCRRISTPTALKPPPLRPLGGELDALEGRLLKAYRPPASIEKNGPFLEASATLKEARELDAAGLRYGAMLRYLESAQRVAAIVSPPALSAAEVSRRLKDLDARLAAGGVDHSIGRMLLEQAQAELASLAPGARPGRAALIAAEALPRYFAALKPAPPEPPKVAPIVTVTFVRWPYI